MNFRRVVAAAALFLAISTAASFAEPIDEIGTPLDRRGNDLPFLPSGEKAPPNVDLGFFESGSSDLKELEVAFKAFREGKLKDAEALLDAAREAHPNLPPSKLMLARLYMQHGDQKSGRQMMELAAAKHPQHPEVYMAFGNLALAENRLADAMLHFNTAATIPTPGSWPKEQVDQLQRASLIGRLMVWERRGEWQVAANVLKKLVDLQPSDPQLRDRYGADLFLAGKEREAFEQFEISFRQDGQMNRPEISIAVMLIRRGDYTQANRWFTKAVEKFPNEPRVHFEFSSALLHQDQANFAKKHADRAAELGMDGAGLLMQRGLIARHMGDYEAAEEFFEQMRQLSPSNFAAVNQLALVLAEQNDPEKLRRAAEFATLNARQYSRNPQALATLGWVSHRMGRQTEAERLLKAAVATSGVGPEAVYYLANVLDDTDESTKQKIVAALRKAVEAPGLFVLRPKAKRWLSEQSG